MATNPDSQAAFIRDFQDQVFSYYHEHKRDLAWRDVDSEGIINPYHVVVSELMLQQTQVQRVQSKFEEFIATFADFKTLAEASTSDVLRVWSGLGYNRRAKYLHDFARAIVDSDFPNTVDQLSAHKGVGKNTAAAILVYAFDKREVFVETNIRTVYLNHFFQDAQGVSDTDILSKVSSTLPEGSVREWYWALMDYGTFLKKQGKSKLSQASSYKKQSAFKGSTREVRAKIIKVLIEKDGVSKNVLESIVDDSRTSNALAALEKDGLVVIKKDVIFLP